MTRKSKTPTQLAHERMLTLLNKTVYMARPPEHAQTYRHQHGYDPIKLIVVKVGKIKSKLLYRLGYWAGPQTYMVNNKDIYTEEDWAEARDKWAKEKLWEVLTKK